MRNLSTTLLTLALLFGMSQGAVSQDETTPFFHSTQTATSPQNLLIENCIAPIDQTPNHTVEYLDVPILEALDWLTDLERIWGIDCPVLAPPYRTHGGVI